jgi:hypothetical protein
MPFQISGLPIAQFMPLFALSDAELRARQIVRCVASEYPGFPCRVSLRDAAVGERVLLLNYEHLAVSSPYRSRYAIYVRENAEPARLAVDEVPEVLTRRLLSVRGFDDEGMLLAADVVQGEHLARAIDALLSPSAVCYLHVHNAKHGCFAARVDRR